MVPWAQLIAVSEPLYPTSGRVGHQPMGVSKMLRIYRLQQWCGLADEALEDAIYDCQVLRDFVGIDHFFNLIRTRARARVPGLNGSAHGGDATGAAGGTAAASRSAARALMRARSSTAHFPGVTAAADVGAAFKLCQQWVDALGLLTPTES